MDNEWLGADVSNYGSDYDYDRRSDYPFSYGRVLPTEQRALHWQKVATTEEISTSLLANSALTLEESRIPERLLATLTSYVLTDHVMSRTQWAEMEHPRSWWQHFKRDVMPKWFTRRYPVRNTVYQQAIRFEEDRNYVLSRKLPEDSFGKPYIVETVVRQPWETLR